MMNKIKIIKIFSIVVVFLAVFSVIFFILNRNPNVSESVRLAPASNEDIDYASVSEDYEIIYYPKTRTYSIVILSPDFEATRLIAEKEFLNKYKLDEEQACLYKVVIGTPRHINPSLSTRDYKLSFCE